MKSKKVEDYLITPADVEKINLVRELMAHEKSDELLEMILDIGYQKGKSDFLERNISEIKIFR